MDQQYTTGERVQKEPERLTSLIYPFQRSNAPRPSYAAYL